MKIKRSRLVELLLLVLLLVITSVRAQLTIENVTNSSITNESAIITWDTVNLSNATVNYNISTSLGIYAYNSSEVTLGHQVYLENLTPNTLYYYNVSSCTNESICEESGPYNFTTDDNPSISGAVIYPTVAYSSDNLTCNATPTDAKNTTLTVEYWWYNGTDPTPVVSGNTTGVSNGTNSLITTLGSDNTTVGETWNCTVRTFDGLYYSDYTSATKTIIAPTSCGDIYNDTTLVIDVNSNGTCFTILNDSITLDCAGYSITGNGTGIGINVTGYGNITLIDCSVTNFSYGVYVSNSQELTLTNNTYGQNSLYEFYALESNVTLTEDWTVNSTQNLFMDKTNISVSGIVYMTDSADITFTNSMSAIFYFKNDSVGLFENSTVNSITSRQNTSVILINSNLTGYYRIYSEDDASLTIDGLIPNISITNSIQSATTSYAINVTNSNISYFEFYFYDNSTNVITNSIFKSVTIEGGSTSSNNMTNITIEKGINIGASSNSNLINLTIGGVSYFQDTTVNFIQGLELTGVLYLENSSVNTFENSTIDGDLFIYDNTNNTFNTTSFGNITVYHNSINTFINSTITDSLYLLDNSVNTFENCSIVGFSGGDLSGESAKIETDSNKLTINESFASVKAELNDSNLPQLLSNRTYLIAEYLGSSSFAYTQKLEWGVSRNASIQFLRDSDYTDPDNPYLMVYGPKSLGTGASKAKFMWYTLTFPGLAESYWYADEICGYANKLCNFEGTTMEIMGTKYTVTKAERNGNSIIWEMIGGGHRIVLTDANTSDYFNSNVTIDGIEIEGLYTDFFINTGANYVQIDKIVLWWAPADELFAAVGDELLFPRLGSYKVEFEGMTHDWVEEGIILRPHGDDKIELSAPLEAGTTTLDILYSSNLDNWTNFGKAATNASGKLWTTAGIIWVGDYLVLSDATERKSHIVEIDNINSQNVTRIKDLADGATYQATCTNGCTISVGDVDLVLTSVNYIEPSVVVSASSDASAKIYTKKGLTIDLRSPISNKETHNISIVEEDQNGVLESGTNFTISAGFNSSKSTIKAITPDTAFDVAPGKDTYYEYNDSGEMGYYTTFGTKLIHNKSGSQYSVRITYPTTEAYANVFVNTETPAVSILLDHNSTNTFTDCVFSADLNVRNLSDTTIINSTVPHISMHLYDTNITIDSLSPSSGITRHINTTGAFSVNLTNVDVLNFSLYTETGSSATITDSNFDTLSLGGTGVNSMENTTTGNANFLGTSITTFTNSNVTGNSTFDSYANVTFVGSNSVNQIIGWDVNTVGKNTIRGNITINNDTIATISSTRALSRFYPTYVVNESGLPDINKVITIQNGSTVLWNGTTDANGYIEPNITFTYADYNVIYDIVATTDIYDINLVTDTPLNISTLITAPSISTPTILPLLAYSSSNLTCNATPTDAESSTLTVEYWWYNGSTLMLSGNTTDVANGTNSLITTLGSDNTTAGETWNCTVRAFDGTYYSDYASSTVTIKNGTSSNYTEFNGSSTDFNSVPNIENVSNATIEITDVGKIVWLNTVNASGQDFDLNINISNNLVSINSSGLHTSFNSSANITLFNTGINDPVILKDGLLCGNECTLLPSSGGNITFSVTGFTSYAATEDSNLTIWDSTDAEEGSQTRGINNSVYFFANYTSTNGTIISNSSEYNGSCQIKFNVAGWGSFEDMIFNETRELYQYNRTFLALGTYQFNVTCNSSISLFNISTLDDLSITMVIENITNTSITNESAVIQWDTDTPSNSSVNYNITLGLGIYTYNSSNVTQGHNVPLTGLLPNTLYYYNISSCDNESNCAELGPYSFTTEDKPSISGVVMLPTVAYSSDNLTCNATPTDAKNTTLTVEYWWYNGTDPTPVVSGNTTGVSNGTNSLITTLGSDNTTVGETWNCTVRTFDGLYYSDYTSATKTIIAPTSCGDIYNDTTLVIDVNVNGTCFTILNNSITLDCAGYSITGNETGIGINVTNYSNIKLKNCNVVNFSYGVYLSNSSNVTWVNNTLSSNIDYGLYSNTVNLYSSSNLIMGGTQNFLVDNTNISVLSSDLYIRNNVNFTINRSTINVTNFYFQNNANVSIVDSVVYMIDDSSESDGNAQLTITNSIFSNSLEFDENTTINANNGTFYSILSRANSTTYFNNSDFTVASTYSVFVYEDSTNIFDNSQITRGKFMGNSINRLTNTNFSQEFDFEGGGLNITNLSYVVPGTNRIYSLSNNFEVNITNSDLYYISVYLTSNDSYVTNTNISYLSISGGSVSNNIQTIIVQDATVVSSSANTIQSSNLGDATFRGNSSSSVINCTMDSLVIWVDNGNITLNDIRAGTLNRNISSSTTSYQLNLTNTNVSQLSFTALNSTWTSYGVDITTLKTFHSDITIGNYTNISILNISDGLSTINFTTQSYITNFLDIIEGEDNNSYAIIYGLVNMPSSVSFNSGNLTIKRFYPTYIINQSSLPDVNISITIENSTSVLWNGTTDTNGYIEPNITFTYANYNVTYNIVVNSTDIGDIALLTDTPINETTDLTPPNITDYQPKGTLEDPSVKLEIWTDEAATCRYDTINGTSYDQMNLTLYGEGTYHDHYIGELANGVKTYYVRCRDIHNNTGEQLELSFTVSVWYRSGGGYTPTPSKENPKVMHFWSSILEEGSTIMNIADEEIAFTRMIFSVNTKLYNVEIVVERLLDEPEVIPSHSGTVYQYLQITKDNLKEEDIETVKIRFRIEREWLEQHDINPDNMALYKYTNKWVKLPTKKLNTETNYVHYEATAPSFSLFAISSTAVAQPITPTLQPEQEEMPEDVIVETIEPTIPKESLVGAETLKIILIATIVLVTIIVAGVGFVSYKKMSKSRELTKVEQYLKDFEQPTIELPELERSARRYPELESYIKECLTMEVTMANIRQNLLDVGWQEDVVDEAISKFL